MEKTNEREKEENDERDFRERRERRMKEARENIIINKSKFQIAINATYNYVS